MALKTNLKPVSKRSSAKQKLTNELVKNNITWLKEQFSTEDIDKIKDRKESKSLTKRIFDTLSSMFHKSEESLILSYAATDAILKGVQAIKDQPVIVKVEQESKAVPESKPKEYLFTVSRDSQGSIESIRAKEIK